MSILKGAMGFSRFMVKGDATLAPAIIIEKLNLFRFRPLHERGHDQVSLGWCPYLNEYDPEKTITMADAFFDDRVVLTLRLDSIVIPKPYLKALVKKSLSAYEKDHKTTASKAVRKEIEQAEMQNLRSRLLPKTKVVEAVWSLRDKELKVFTRSTSLLDRMIELFQETFLLELMRRDCVVETINFAHAHNMVGSLENLGHAPLFRPVVRVDLQ